MAGEIGNIYFVTFFVVLFEIRFCSGKYCSYLNGRTSDNKDPCTELEHCFFNIDQTGQCPGNRCEPGWMGPGCQYVNLALNPLNMDIVFDGDMATHRSISAATLNLNGMFIVSAFIIHTRWFNGSLIVRDGHQNVLLRKSVQEVSPTIVLPHPVLTDILNMQFRNPIDIKEIEVFGGKDVALWKPTNQSSTYSEQKINKRVNFTSDKAVDGSGDGNFDNLSCTHTAASQSKRPSWNVNLGEAYSIIAIKIASRKDNQYRINGFNLFGTAENGSKLLIYSDQPPYLNRGEIVLDSNRMLDIPVSVITIEGPHDNEKILTLCEVFVYACIPTSAQGTDQCRSFCPKNCQAEYSCKNGCPVCQDGWMGVYCENPITCQPPVSTEAPHILTDKQKYNYNETIIFSCHEGFDLLGTAEKICTENGALQPPLPRCTAITCQPPVSSDAPHIITDKQKYNYNETIIFSCPEGFDLQGKADRICTENGALQPPLPRCTVITCQPPFATDAPHIITDKQKYNYNETIKFSCPVGFDLQGKADRICTENGALQPPLPRCAAIKCKAPAFTSSDHISTDKVMYSYNEIIRFKCPDGFNIQGDQNRKCTGKETFHPPFPNCTGVRCKTPMLQQKQVMIIPNDTDYEYNSTILFKCKMGFSLKGSQNATCHQNASFWFIEGTPKCEVSQITCRAPFFADDLHISTDKQIYNYSETIRFSCSEGFFLQGTSVRTCKRIGTLQPPFPYCTDITCQRPILSIRGSLQLSTNPLQRTFSYNESISFFCTPGYILHGPTVKYCRQNGDFEQGLPFCTALGKQESPSFTVGFFSGGAVGIVVISSVIFVIFFLRRRLCQQKKKENAWYNGGNHQIDDNGHEYSGIEYQSSDRENQNPNVTEPPVSVSEGHYTETKFDSDDKDHHYTKLNEIKMNQLTEETADRPVQL